MSNSSLISLKKISPNRNSPRNHAIDTVTIHCYVGQVSVESMGEWFGKSSSQVSVNYGIATDGQIGLFVEEKDRSWCSSSPSNDNRAITIECASDVKPPYAINDKVMTSLINLLADICGRNGISKLVWSTSKTDRVNHRNGCNMTVHRDFKNKECPGEYLYSRMGEIARRVNDILRGTAGGNIGSSSGASGNGGNKNVPFYVKVLIDDLNIRSAPSMNGTVKGHTGKGVFTITEVSGNWGRLKSGAGWIYLANASYTKSMDTVHG